MQYRKEIDGLRAIAVSSVVLYHLFPFAAPSGFAGVDVFFVISGFLITGIIAESLEQGRFSFWDFYARRARRILPALFVMCTASFLVGAWLLPPVAFADFALSVLAAMAFIANFHFKDRAGYFEADASDQPLMHTWSLGVEEQFYVIWPILLILLAALVTKRWHLIVISVIVILGLFLAEFMTRSDPDLAFFMLPSRLWELAMGALAFYARPLAMRLPDAAAKLIALASAALLVAFLLGPPPLENFPGIGALPACLPAALLLVFAGTERCPTTFLLSLPPMVFLGLISYSLYLWHWPILIFYGMAFGHPTVAVGIGLLLASVLLATLSWRFIETPLRRAGAHAPVKPQVGLAALAILATAAITLPATLSQGWPWRVPDAVVTIEAEARGTKFGCGEIGTREGCLFGDRGQQSLPHEDLLLVGDSHAQHFLPYFDRLARAQGWTGRMVSQGGCPPLAGIQLRPERFAASCGAVQQAMLDTIAAHREAQFVVIASRWEAYTETQFFEGGFERRKQFIGDALSQSTDTANLRRVLEAGLSEFLDRALALTQAHIVLVHQVPVLPNAPLLCLSSTLKLGEEPQNCAQPAAPILERLSFSRELLTKLAQAHPRVTALDPLPHFCDAQRCRTYADGHILYADKNHLTTIGAQSLFEKGFGTDLFVSAKAQRPAQRD
ncbi:MAG: acyltransferase [Neomegalonema sp.]|nr:acyltransferase [Neomegalonema sp.]